MKTYLISGTSSGIGNSLAKLYLKNKDNYLIGISRSIPKELTSYENYIHIKIDLKEIENISLLKETILNAKQEVPQNFSAEKETDKIKLDNSKSEKTEESKAEIKLN